MPTPSQSINRISGVLTETIRLTDKSEIVLFHINVSQARFPIWSERAWTDVDDTARIAWEQAKAHCEALGGAQKFSLSTYDIAGKTEGHPLRTTVFTVDAPLGIDSDSTSSEPPSQVGLLAQLMRHNQEMARQHSAAIGSKEIPMQSSNHAAIGGKPRHLGGWRKDPPDHRDRALDVPALLSAAPLPPWIDLSTICSPVEDQGYLGSCVANSSTSAMEALLKKTNRPLLNFSRLFVYYYTRKIDRVPSSEDSGCTIRSAMKCLSYFGVAMESLWPYEEEKFSVAPSYTAIKDAKTHQILKYYRCPNLSSTKRSLAQGFTIVGGFSVPESMMSDECARTGIVKYPEPTEGFSGGHAIHFVGYNDQTKMLKFQNSWGTGWGEKGFGYLPYKFVEDGLSEDFWTIRAEE